MTRQRSARAGWLHVHREGGGVIQCAIYRARHLPRLTVRAHSGEPTAVTALEVISDTLQGFYAARETPRPMLCLCCGGPVPVPLAIIIVTAARDDPRHGVAGVICPTCDGTDDQVEQRILVALREMVYPDLRKITVHQQTGHG